MNGQRIDWGNGAWRRGDAGETAAEIVICGDWAPIRDFREILLADPEAIYGDVLPEIRSADLRIVNLECPLTDHGAPVHKSGSVLKGDAAHVKGLSVVPFDVATLGNNHVFDYGRESFFETCDLLARHRIAYVGAGPSAAAAQKPLVVRSKGIVAGIISFSEGEDLTAAGDGPGVYGWDVDRVVAQVRALKSEVNVVIVICHGGVEYIPYPPPYLAGALQRIAEAGADLVVAHHPHVPQGIAIHGETPICYSLGNFVFFQPTDLQYRKIGYLVRAWVTETGVSGIRIVPYEIRNDGLRLLQGDSRRRLFEKLEMISRPLDSPAGITDAWNGFLRYYGVEGFQKEIEHIMAHVRSDLPKGAAMFRNRLTTLQHHRHLVDLMTRIIDGTLDDGPAWAVAQVAEWFTRKAGPA